MAVSASLAAPARPLVLRAPERGADAWAGLAGGVLDLLHEAVFAIARDFTLLGANRAARQLLREADGLLLAQRMLVAATPAATAELRRSVAALACGAVRRIEVPRPGRPPLALRVEAHPQAAAWGAAAVIFAGSGAPAAGEPPASPALRFGFTPTECDVARRLAAGERLVRIAAELGITLHTVRGHLKHLYAKAGVHRQAELVARLLAP